MKSVLLRINFQSNDMLNKLAEIEKKTDELKELLYELEKIRISTTVEETTNKDEDYI